VLQVGETGAILVDTKSGPLTEQVLAEIRKLVPQGKTLRIIMNTSADADHIGGNQRIAETLGSSANWAIINTPGGSNAAVKIVAHDNVLPRVNGLKNTAWPTETFIEADREFFFNGEPVSMRHVAAAHTDGDSIVVFRKSDVVATGDIFRTDSYPVIDLARGGSVQGVLNGLNLVLDIAIPEHHEEGGTMIVPGHGRIADEFDLVEYRDMVTIVKDRIQALIKKGMTLEQVKAERPTRDYDSRYGADSGAWTTDQFVEAVFKSLTSPATSTQ
jgi:glyoxylase-like metal-dependent hydrolase (beta-lactamase superfamily II)